MSLNDIVAGLPMSGEVRVGTSGWHYPSGHGTWNGPFYPLKRPRGFDELRFYAERFDTVEVNATFYRQPEATMSRQWLDRTPASFLFSIKLFQKFTHPDMYLQRPGATEWDVTAGDVDQFRAGLDPIAAANRLGALLMQFPSSFHATPDARAYVSWLLRAFADYPRAVEFRHKSWSEPGADTIERLDDAGAALVRIDEPFARLEGVRVSGEQGAKVLRTKVPLAYLRLHGRNAAQWWDHAHAEDRYNYLYTAAELQPIADLAKDEAALEKRVLVYFNNHFSAKAVANADILKNQLGQLMPDWQLRP
jgi:uncharacterized protein YecE (DUF72 family)